MKGRVDNIHMPKREPDKVRAGGRAGLLNMAPERGG